MSNGNPQPDPTENRSESDEPPNSDPCASSDSKTPPRSIKWRRRLARIVRTLNVLAAAAAIFGIGVYISEGERRARSILVDEAQLRANAFAQIEEARKSTEIASVTNLDKRKQSPECDTAKDANHGSLPFWACPSVNQQRADIPSYVLSALALIPESLKNASLDNLRIKRANWPSQRFHSTSLRFSSIADSNLENAEMTQADAAFSDFYRVSLRNSCVDQLKSQGAEFSAVDLSGARIDNWDANGGKFNQVSFAGSRIYQGSFIGAVFVLADFRDSQINGGKQPYPCGHTDAPSFKVPVYRANNMFVGSGKLDDPYLSVRSLPGGGGERYRPRVLVAFSDLRSARISFDMFGRNDDWDVIYMNVCTNDATHVSPSPPPDAIDCSWVGKSTLSQVELRYDKHFQHLIRYEKNTWEMVRVDMGDTRGFQRVARFSTQLYADPN